VEAYNLLAGSRAAGPAGPLPIPLSEIESYCRLFGWRGAEEVADLVEILQAMDAAYLEVVARRAEERREDERERPARGNPKPRGRRR
jgi:hypothetical protein